MSGNEKQASPENKTPSKQSVRKPVRTRAKQDVDLDNMMVKGEEVILRADLHGALYWKSIAVFVFALLVLLFVARPIGILLFIVAAVMLCICILTQHFLLLAVTNKRVLARYGLLQMDVVDIRLSQIESIDLERMLPGHIFGYANVVVMGTGQRMIRVPFIRNAEAFRRYYNELVLANEGNEEAEEEIKRTKAEEERVEQAIERKKSKKK